MQLIRRLSSVVVPAALLTAILNPSSLLRAENEAIGFALTAPSKPVSSGAADSLLFTGSFQYQVPIEVPPGVAGMQPAVVLRYVSGLGNGWLGVGWDLSFGSIERSTRNGPPRYDDTDTMVSMVSGQAQELVRQGDGTYRAQIEGGFQRFTRSGDSWIVLDKVGNKFFYGSAAASRVGPAAGTAVWALDRVEDRNGNAYEVTYRTDGGQLYPDAILYTTNRAGLVGDRKVTFVSTVRPDPFTTSRFGYKQTNARVLTHVITSVNKAGTWEVVRDYFVGYLTPSGKTRLTVSSVYIGGALNGNSLLLTPTLFSYPASGTSWSVQAAGSPFQLPEYILSNWADNGVRFVELNGDGRPDFIQSIDSRHVAYLNTPTGWQEAPAWEPDMPVILTNQAGVRDNGVRAVDLNGDGLTDLIQSHVYDGVRFRHAWLNNGSGWTAADATWALPTSPEIVATVGEGGGSPFSRDNGVQFADMNGDGRPDVVQSVFFGGSNSGVRHVFLNNGAGWTPDDRYNVPEYLTVCAQDSRSARPNGTMLIDLNGDGLADVVQALSSDNGTSSFKTYLNRNPGWDDVSATWVLPDFLIAIGQNGGIRDSGSQLIDLNGDGLPDWVQSVKERCTSTVKQRVFLNTGVGWQASSGWTFPGFFSEPSVPFIPSPKFPTCSEYSLKVNGYSFLDVNADGMPDLIRSLPAADGGSFIGLSSARPDLLDDVKLMTGGRIYPTYTPIASVTTGHRVPFPLHVLTRLDQNDSRGNVSRTDLTYEGGLFDPELREFLGFSKVTSVDNDGNKTVSQFYQRNDANGIAVPHAALKGRPSLTTRYDSSGRLLESESSTWGWTPWMPGVTLPQLSQHETVVPGLSPSNTLVTRDTYFYDTATAGQGYGNLTRIVHAGDVNVAGDERTEETDFAENAPGYLGGFPKASRTKDAAGKIMAETQYFYDGSTVLGNVGKGNLTQVSVWLDKPASKWIVTKTGYNAWGQPLWTDDAKGNRTSLAYDAHGLPATATNPAGHIGRTEIDLRNGHPLSETDINGQVTLYRYDALGRLLREVGPLDSDALPTTEYVYHDETLGLPSHHVDVNRRVQHGAPDVLWARSYLDGLGRGWKTEREDATTSSIATVTDYELRGLVRRVSLPFDGAGTPALWTESTYDGLGRPVRVSNPDGTFQSTTFDGRITTTLDEKGRSHRTESDGWGQVAKRFEPGLAVPTRYVYDGAGRLAQLINPKGAVTTFSYDSLGRKLSMSDPNTGTWTYSYDDNGNLTEQTDARGVKLALRYDALNRLLDRKMSADPNHATSQTVGATLASFIYDETSGRPTSKGKLTSFADATGTAALYHDRLGRITTDARTIDSVRYETRMGYDALDRLTAVTYPSDAVVRYRYNAAGELDRVTDDTGSVVYASYSGFDPMGRPGLADFAGGKTRTTLAYHPQKQTLASLKTESLSSGAPATLQSLTYAFDAVGNLSSVTDAVDPTRSQSFVYDDLDRLASAAGLYGNQVYRYDDAGNFRDKAAQSYLYGDAAHPDAVTATQSAATFGIDTATVMSRDFEPSESDVVAAGLTLTAGYRGSAVSFDGINNVFIASATESAAPPQYTFMAWVRPTAYPTTGYATIIAKSTAAILGALSNGTRLLMDSSGKLVFEMGRASAPLSFTSAGPIALNRWAFVCASFDGGKARIFVNGAQQSSRVLAWSPAASAAPVTVGASVTTARAPAPSTALKGLIDDPRFQARAWPVSELLALYNAYQAAPSAVTYLNDAAGNRTSKTSGASTWTYSFDADGKLVKVLEGSTARGTFVYDAAGSRVKKTTAQGTTLTIGKHYEARPNGDRIDHVFANGQLVCDIVRNGGGTQTFYSHPDHLGSAAVITDGSGIRVQSLSYAPFGETAASDGASPLRRKYTGQEEDAETGLYYYNARYYDPALGRFISPDSIVGDPGSSQALNRYAYVGNAPMTHIDPSGNSIAAFGAIVGGIAGAIQGYEYARSRGYEWYRPQTFLYMQEGGIVGAAAGGAGGVVAGLDLPFGGTQGIAASSFIYSTAMSTIFGEDTSPSVSIGAASYNLRSGEIGYLGEHGNSAWGNVGYGLGALANIGDLWALGNANGVTLETESGDMISHSQITVPNDSLFSFGPDRNNAVAEFKNALTPEKKLFSKYLFRLDRSTNRYQSDGQFFSTAISRVNPKAITLFAESLGRITPYWAPGTNCVNMAALSLNFAGVPAIGIHPLILAAQMYARSQGFLLEQYGWYLQK